MIWMTSCWFRHHRNPKSLLKLEGIFSFYHQDGYRDGQSSEDCCAEQQNKVKGKLGLYTVWGMVTYLCPSPLLELRPPTRLEEWLMTNGIAAKERMSFIDVPLVNMTKDEMNYFIGRFIRETRKKMVRSIHDQPTTRWSQAYRNTLKQIICHKLLLHPVYNELQLMLNAELLCKAR